MLLFPPPPPAPPPRGPGVRTWVEPRFEPPPPPNLARNTCPLRRFQPKKTQKRYVFGRSAVRSGNGPTSEIRALYGVLGPKRFKKGTYLEGWWGIWKVGGRVRSKYMPFTAFSGPKRPKQGTYLVGGSGLETVRRRRRGGGSGSETLTLKYVPFRAFSGPKRPQTSPEAIPKGFACFFCFPPLCSKVEVEFVNLAT